MKTPSSQDKAIRKVNFTVKWLDALKPQTSKMTYWDLDQKHLAVRITPNGHKSFMVMRQIGKGGKLAIRTIGTYPDIGLKDAREQAEEMVKLMRKGVDPYEERRRIEREVARKQANSVAAVVEEYLKRHVADLRASTRKDVEHLLRRELLGEKLDDEGQWVIDQKKDSWRDRPITSITRGDVTKLIEDVLDRIKGQKRVGHRGKNKPGQGQARKLLANVRKLFSWTLDRDMYGLDSIPVVKAANIVKMPQARSRVLDDDELKAVWAAAKLMGYPFGSLMQALLLTGLRRGELSDARWSEIKDDMLTIPAERMKGKIDHRVPLTPTILDLFMRFDGGDFIFSTRGGKVPISGFSKYKAQLDRDIAKLRAKERGAAKPTDKDTLKPWTIHDLRRSMRSRLSAIGVLPHIAEMVLAHKQPGIQAVYDKHLYDDEKRDALKRWERALLAIVEPSPTNNVTDLSAERAKRA